MIKTLTCVVLTIFLAPSVFAEAKEEAKLPVLQIGGADDKKGVRERVEELALKYCKETTDEKMGKSAIKACIDKKANSLASEFKCDEHGKNLEGAWQAFTKSCRDVGGRSDQKSCIKKSARCSKNLETFFDEQEGTDVSSVQKYLRNCPDEIAVVKAAGGELDKKHEDFRDAEEKLKEIDEKLKDLTEKLVTGENNQRSLIEGLVDDSKLENQKEQARYLEENNGVVTAASALVANISERRIKLRELGFSLREAQIKKDAEDAKLKIGCEGRARQQIIEIRTRRAELAGRGSYRAPSLNTLYRGANTSQRKRDEKLFRGMVASCVGGLDIKSQDSANSGVYRLAVDKIKAEIREEQSAIRKAVSDLNNIKNLQVDQALKTHQLKLKKLELELAQKMSQAKRKYDLNRGFLLGQQEKLHRIRAEALTEKEDAKADFNIAKGFAKAGKGFKDIDQKGHVSPSDRYAEYERLVDSDQSSICCDARAKASAGVVALLLSSSGMDKACKNMKKRANGIDTPTQSQPKKRQGKKGSKDIQT